MSDISLKTFRRTIYAPKTHAVREALREILRGLRYRHEFAKRNLEVLKASRELLEAFGITPARAETFLCPNQETFLTDDLMGRFSRVERPRREQLKLLLAEFLKMRRVLPMAKSRQSFFPPFSVKNAWKIWNSLLQFELFAMGRLDIGGPVMFPVMYVGGLSFNENKNEQKQLSRTLNLAHEPYPMVVKFELPDEVISNYMTAFGATLYEKYPELRRPSRNGPIKRLHDEDFDLIIKAHDLKDYPPPRGGMEAEMKKLHRQKFPHRSHNSRTVLRDFSGWRKTARRLIDRYDIIA
jgi:hypothetical protein